MSKGQDSLENSISCLLLELVQGVQSKTVLVVIFFVFLKVLFFSFVVAICDLGQEVEIILHLL